MRIALIYLGRRGAGGWISYELALHLQNKFPTLTVTSQYLEQKRLWDLPQTEKLITTTFRNALQAILTLVFPIDINSLVQKIQQYTPDVLLFPMFHPWNALIQIRMRGIPAVVFVHDPHPHPDLAGWLYSKLEQVSIKKANRCIIMSENLKEALIKRGVEADKIDVIPLGPFRSTLSKPRMPRKEKFSTLLFFGRIAPYKGMDILLQAYAEIRRTHQIGLLIAGEGNIEPFQGYLDTLPDVQLINRWIAEDEIADLFAQADLLVLPYSSASQSGVIPIAASFGLPVIATSTGGIPEQIEDGISGWLIEARNREALVNAIKDALDHPEVAQQRGALLRSRYENQFNWEDIARQVGESLKRAERARGQT